METARHCAYNVSRNVLLSERVWCAGESLDQAELLELVMNGPGLDRHAGVWIRRTPGWLDLPRPFALDFVYLDDQLRVVELGGVNLTTEFPVAAEAVAGALILASRRLAETGIVAGDLVRICGQEELPALVKAAASSAVQPGPARTPSSDGSSAGQASPSTLTPFQVSRYSEFVFEPFAGSLVYLPEAACPPPQSSEFFLPERAPANQKEGAAEKPAEAQQPEPVESPAVETKAKPAKVVARRQRQVRKKAAVPQEEPHFYTPKPIRFFDPAALAAQQDSHERSATEEQPPLREPTQLSPELKAAILQIDEQLRREKEELAPEKPKDQAKERKRKPPKKTEGITAEQESMEAAHPAWEELAEPARPSEAMIAAETQLVEKILEEAESAAEATLELRPEPSPAAEIELLPESLAELPADDSGADEEAVSFSEPVLPVEESSVPPEPAEPETAEPEAAELETAEPETAELEPAEYEWTSPAEEVPTPADSAPEWVSSEEAISFPTEVEDAESASAVEETPSREEVIPPAPAEPEVVAIASSIEAIEHASVLPVQRATPQPSAETAAPVPSPAKTPKPAKQKPAKQKPALRKRLKQWIGREIGDKRRGERTAVPGLVAFYWSGGAPRPHEVVNISKSGFYLRTRELWLPDTLVRMTLQRPEEQIGSGKDSIRVLARVVRIDDGGVGHEFVTIDALRHVRSRDVLPEDGTNPKELEKFLSGGTRG